MELVTTMNSFQKSMAAQKEMHCQIRKSNVPNGKMDTLGFIRKSANETNADSASTHVNYLLSNLSVKHMQDSNAICLEMPNIRTSKKSNDYRVYDKRDAFASHIRRSGEGGTVNWRNTRATTDTFSCQVYRIGEKATDELLANDDLMEWWQVKTASVVEDSLIDREKQMVEVVFDSTAWDNTVALQAAEQFDKATSTPIQLFRKERERVRKECGRAANVAIFDPDSWRALLDNAQLVGRSNQSSSQYDPTRIMRSTVAMLLELDEVYVLNMIEYDGDLDSTTTDNSYVAEPGQVWLGYIDKNPSRDTMTAFSQFSWNGMDGMNDFGTRIRTYRWEDESEARVVQDNAFAWKIVTKSAGNLITNCVSSSFQL